MQRAIRDEFQQEAPKIIFYQQRSLYSAKAYLQARNILDAADFIRLGARVPLVCTLTKMEKAGVRCLYHHIQGLPSSPGQTPFTDTWYLKRDLRQLHANFIWRLHQALTLTVRSDARILIDVYESNMHVVQQPLIKLHGLHSCPNWYQ